MSSSCNGVVGMHKSVRGMMLPARTAKDQVHQHQMLERERSTTMVPLTSGRREWDRE